MMKLIFVTTLLLSSASVLAHNNSFSGNACDIELLTNISVSPEAIEFSQNDSPLYTIINNEKLYVAGNEISLSGGEQTLLTSYSTKIREVFPEIRSITIEGIDVAIQGLNLAFNELLGEGNQAGIELTSQLQLIAEEVDTKFTGDFILNEEGLIINDQAFMQASERRIENIVEHSLTSSVGSLLVAVGQEMLFSRGDSDAFQQKMEDFGEKIEHEMELRANNLGQRANALCKLVHSIDNLEEELKLNIQALPKVNVLYTKLN
jgi:hypothetical protein